MPAADDKPFLRQNISVVQWFRLHTNSGWRKKAKTTNEQRVFVRLPFFCSFSWCICVLFLRVGIISDACVYYLLYFSYNFAGFFAWATPFCASWCYLIFLLRIYYCLPERPLPVAMLEFRAVYFFRATAIFVLLLKTWYRQSAPLWSLHSSHCNTFYTLAFASFAISRTRTPKTNNITLWIPAPCLEWHEYRSDLHKRTRFFIKIYGDYCDAANAFHTFQY